MTLCPRSMLIAAVALLAVARWSEADEPDWQTMDYTPHANFQAVDSSGFGVFQLDDPIKMRGIILSNSEEMLDSTPGAPVYLGGLWQVYVQAADTGDFGGTACWMGQYIGKIVGNHPAGSYSDAEWLDELYRLTHDPDTGHEFQPGDLVEIRARAPGLHHRGKNNVNEKHLNVPEMDFDIVLLEPAQGLPAPTVLTLAALKDAGNEFIWDPTRQAGPEHFQGSLVRINGVTFVDSGGWGPDAELDIQDGTGRTFPVKLGLGDGFSMYGPPTGAFDVVGILDQEDTDSNDGHKAGYRLWIMQNYDGNQYIIPAIWPLPGDLNCDGIVNGFDIDAFVLALQYPDTYAATHQNCDINHGDINGDGVVNGFDIDGFVALLIGG
ncbi:MAG: hypothetical protein KKB50_07155 [Planctomycetes bacterium]|nr:hypothetical protein [Planctomycetota bacterium]